jgi:hypothetical protein
MKELEKVLATFLVVVIIAAIYFGNGYFKIKNAMDSIKVERRTHKRIVKIFKNDILDLEKTIQTLKNDKKKLNERLIFMLQDATMFPDMEFINSLAKKLKGTDNLHPESQLGKLYIGKVVLSEKQVISTFFKKKKVVTFKFDPLNIISRAEFSLDNPKNKIIEQMKHKNVYEVNFIGYISTWDGRFQLEKCRITGIWDHGVKK